MKRFGVTQTAEGATTRFRLSAFQIISDGPEDNASVAVRWNVRNAFHASTSDLALLLVEPASKVPERWDQRAAQLSIVVPRVGDRVVAFG